MNELKLKLVAPNNVGYPLVRIDGETVTPKRNKYSNLEYNYQTDKQTVKIEVFRCMDTGGILWFIAQLFFFVISVFGLFDIHRRERCVTLEFAAEADLTETSVITLRCKPRKENAAAIETDTALVTRETVNRCYVDERARKKLRVLTVAKIITAIAVIAAVIAVIILKRGS